MIAPARRAALDVVLRVEAGAWASELLLHDTASLDSRDAGLASEIVYGSLRRQAQLDYLIGFYSGRAADTLDPPVRAALRIAIYQLRYMDRVPAHAAVGESVAAAKQAGPRAAGFVNAVLRKVTRAPVPWPDRQTELSMPLWLLESWDRQFGAEVADRIAAAALEPPETWVRHPPADAPLQLEPTEVPGAFRVLSGPLSGLRVQDIGSQSIVPLLELSPGHDFLDVCAAPGNKTAQALESGVTAVACDRHWHRLRQVEGCARVLLDAAEGLPFRSEFDRILVDAPCSGTGTLGRNPEIRWKLTPADIRELHGRQTLILRNSLAALRPGGRLVYSTCSLEKKENEDVVERVLRRVGDAFTLVSTLRRTPGIDPGDGFFAAVIIRAEGGLKRPA